MVLVAIQMSILLRLVFLKPAILFLRFVAVISLFPFRSVHPRMGVIKAVGCGSHIVQGLVVLFSKEDSQLFPVSLHNLLPNDGLPKSSIGLWDLSHLNPLVEMHTQGGVKLAVSFCGLLGALSKQF
jgi:hypothetical protein